jgi:hypothetical protein
MIEGVKKAGISVGLFFPISLSHRERVGVRAYGRFDPNEIPIVACH